MVTLDPLDQEYLDQLIRVKVFWSTQLYPRLFDLYRERVSARGSEPATVDEVEALLEPTAAYQMYAALETNLQREKYAILLNTFGRHEREMTLELDSAPATPGALELDPTLALPDYYTGVDFHNHPGGVWSDDIDGFVYEYAALSTNPTFANNEVIFRQLAQSLPAGDYSRLLDVGCGFGKSTTPLAEVFPHAHITGVDLSAPCLKLAHLRAVQRGMDIRYCQQNAERMSFPDGSFDLVTAEQLFHELPRPAFRNMLRELHRVLRPGGSLIALDFYAPGGPFETFIFYSHSRRNQEPFMPVFAETDLQAEFSEAGFTGLTVEPFGQELGLGAAAGGQRPREWRFPWKKISARKPA